MIRDARVLRTDFVPREVEHRDHEVNYLSEVLRPLTDGDPADTVLVTGPTGTGKTCVTQFVGERLREETLDVEFQYVNCWRHYTFFRCAYAVLDGMNETMDVHRQSTPGDELLARLEEYDGPPRVLVLDEVDQLEDLSLLYDLHELPRFAPVLIANREAELFGQIDDRLTSRLRGSERIRFEKYALDQLVAILEARARRGLTEDAVGTAELERIADAAAGDARVGISILRSAARKADRDGDERITAETVEAAIPDAREEVHQRNLENLTRHQKILYDVVEDAGEIEPSAVYERYRERVAEPKSNRTVRNYLQKMAQYDLIEIEGTSRARVYRSLN
jgi:orc1/cdc6 family replication initiation protein